MKAGDVLLFIGGPGIIDESIRLETHSKYTHAALAISSDTFLEAWWDGARINALCNISNEHVRLFEPVTALTDIQIALLTGYANGKVGEEYNFLQLLGFVLERLLHITHNPFGSTHKTICSQLVVEGYASIGISLLPDLDSYSVSPGDISKSKLLKQGAEPI